ncbi:MAG: sigma-70 family RNA polymerase sigma factor [Methylophilaceae bacterium]
MSDDDELMRQYCVGDVAAFQRLYARHEKPLYRYVRRVLGAAEQAHAEDVFQDVWERMIDARESWTVRADAGFKTWLFTLAHHRAVDVLRRSGREISADEGWLDEDGESAWQLWPAPVAEQPEQQAFWRKAGQQLLECLESLPMQQRAAFLLHHDEHLSLDEMSKVLNAEFETVKSRLRYALSKLKTCMGAYMQPILRVEGQP